MFFNHGVLGISARNLLYIKPYNPRKAIKMADNKIKTKHFLSARDIPVPRLYGVINKNEEVESFDYNNLPSSFVIKPNLGYGGEGIIPILDRDRETGDWIKASGEKISPEQYKSHINDILDGRFSVSGVGDCAFFEQLIISDERIGRFSYKGLPDIRIIVYNLVPVMAMLRIPTKASDGKANLHMGAIGAGIDMAKGTITHVLRGNKIVDEEFKKDPDGLFALKIPYWDEMLYIASKIQLITNLGYLAVDLAIDKTIGPVLLEMNARAGLNVQIANLAPLRKRLAQVEGIKVNSPEKGVRVSKDIFGNLVKKEIEKSSGKPLIGINEEIEIMTVGEIKNVKAEVSLGRKESFIDAELAKDMGLITEQQFIEEDKISLKIKFQLKNKKISTLAHVKDLSKKSCKFIIGTRDLSSFLVDPSISNESTKKIPDPLEVVARTKIREKIDALHKSLSTVNYSEIDNELFEIEKGIKLLHHLKPLNLEEEIAKVEENQSYNPVFYYPEIKFNPFDLKKRLSAIRFIEDTPLDKIFRLKKAEILRKILLLEHIGTDRFTAFSVDLYGKPDAKLITLAEEELKSMPTTFEIEKEDISAHQAAAIFETTLKKYHLKKWKVKLAESLVSDCIAGKKNIIFIRKDAVFSEQRIKTLIAHEIETHVLSAENGKLQPYKIFNRGTASYLETQEGLAIYNQNRLLNPNQEKWYWPISTVIAVETALHGSFSDVVKKMLELGFSLKRSIRVAVKVKRGLEDTSQPGAFTKDMVYYKGYLDISNYLKSGGKIENLYIGKISLPDLETIKKIPGILKPRHLPNWLVE